MLSNQASPDKKKARTIQKKILNLRSKFDTNVLMMNEVIKLRGKLSDEEIRTESEFRLLLLLMNIQRNKVKDIKLINSNTINCPEVTHILTDILSCAGTTFGALVAGKMFLYLWKYPKD